MTTQPQIDTCRKLAEAMEQKGVKWEWEVGDWYIRYYARDYSDDLPILWSGTEGFIPVGYIPIPTFTRCVEVLREWGWIFEILTNQVSGVTDFTSPEGVRKYVTENINCQFYKQPALTSQIINVTAYDPDHAGQLALLEAVGRKE